MRQTVLTIALVFAVIFLAGNSIAQDPTKVDSKHYKVEFENENVRVLRINYGPGEKSVLHEHPNAVAVFLKGSTVKFTDAEGKTTTVSRNTGEAMWTPAGKHLPENIGSEPLEVLLIELK